MFSYRLGAVALEMACLAGARDQTGAFLTYLSEELPPSRTLIMDVGDPDLLPSPHEPVLAIEVVWSLDPGETHAALEARITAACARVSERMEPLWRAATGEAFVL